MPPDVRHCLCKRLRSSYPYPGKGGPSILGGGHGEEDNLQNMGYLWGTPGSAGESSSNRSDIVIHANGLKTAKSITISTFPGGFRRWDTSC